MLGSHLAAHAPGATPIVAGKACKDAGLHESGSPRVKTPKTPSTPQYSLVNLIRTPQRASRSTLVRTATPPGVDGAALPDVKFQMGGVYDVVPGVLAFVCIKDKKQLQFAMKNKPTARFFTSDYHSEYAPIGGDFGPVDLDVMYKFFHLAQSVLDQRSPKQLLVYYFGDAQADVVNSLLLLGCFSIAHLGQSGQQAYRAFRRLKPCPFPAYRDASPIGVKSTFDVTLQDCLYAFANAKSKGWLDADAAVQLGDYVSWKKEGLGEFHYVCPRLASFQGPTMVRKMVCPGLFTCTPIDPIDVFLAHDVSCIVRINMPDDYDTRTLDQAQIRVHELQDRDEEMPSQGFVASVLEIMLEEQGTVVLHSKHGIRATGLLLCIYLVAEEGFTATQSIAWMRMVQPGCIIGQQQHLVYDLWQNSHEFEQLQLLRMGMQDTFKLNLPPPRDGKQGAEAPVATDCAHSARQSPSSIPLFSLGTAVSARESTLAPKREDDIAQSTVLPPKLPLAGARRSTFPNIERAQTSRTARSPSSSMNEARRLDTSRSGWLTSRSELQRPSAWKNSLGFLPSPRNNPVFNRQDQTSPLRSKVGGKVLPSMGFSKFLSNGANNNYVPPDEWDPELRSEKLKDDRRHLVMKGRAKGTFIDATLLDGVGKFHFSRLLAPKMRRTSRGISESDTTSRDGSSHTPSRVATARGKRKDHVGTLRSTLDAMNADEKLKAPPNSIVLGPTPYVSPGREGKRSPRSVSPLHAKYLSSSTALAAASAIAVPSSSALAVRLQRAPSVDKDMHHSQLMYEGLEVQAERVPGTMVISLARDQEPLSRDFGDGLEFPVHPVSVVPPKIVGTPTPW